MKKLNPDGFKEHNDEGGERMGSQITNARCRNWRSVRRRKGSFLGFELHRLVQANRKILEKAINSGAPRKISRYGLMTGVRGRGAADCSILDSHRGCLKCLPFFFGWRL
jgi:hypothetical protein